MGELKDAKAKAGSAVNRSPDLTGDIDTLGAPAQACFRRYAVFTVSLYLFTIKTYHVQEGLQLVCLQAGNKVAEFGSSAYQFKLSELCFVSMSEPLSSQHCHAS